MFMQEVPTSFQLSAIDGVDEVEISDALLDLFLNNIWHHVWKVAVHIEFGKWGARWIAYHPRRLVAGNNVSGHLPVFCSVKVPRGPVRFGRAEVERMQAIEVEVSPG